MNEAIRHTHANRIDFLVLNISDSNVKGFLMPPNNKFGHEREVLLQSNLTLTPQNEQLIGRNNNDNRDYYFIEISVTNEAG